MISLPLKPKIIQISECRIKKSKPPLSNIDLINYFHGQAPTDASKVVTLLYISEELNYKMCKDLQVYKPKNLNQLLSKS